MRKKDGRAGNTKIDQQWIQEHQQRLFRIEDGEYEGMLGWDGSVETEGSPWVLPPKERSCTATSYIRDEEGRYIMDKEGRRLQRPCYAWPINGSNVCLHHGGGVPRVRRAAQERLVAAADSAAGWLIAIVRNKRTSDKDKIAAINSLLDRAGIRSGVEVEVSDPGFQRVWQAMANSNSGQQDPDPALHTSEG